MKTLRDLKKFDSILINKTSDECIEFFNNRSDLDKIVISVYFPLTEGVIRHNEIIDGENYYSYIYFKDLGEYAILEFYCYNRENYEFNYLMTLKVKQINCDEIGYDVIDVDKNNADDVENRSKSLSRVFEIIFMYMIYIKDNPKVETRVTKKISNNSTDGSYNQKRNRDIVLGERIVYTTSLKDISDKMFVKKKRQRHTDSWSVVAFQRHYKSGKTVIVKSHVRGGGDRKRKTYLVK